MRKRILCFICAALTALNMLPSAFAESSAASLDNEAALENEAAEVLKSLNVWVSYNTDEFKPDRPMYRSEYIKCILNIMSDNNDGNIGITEEQAKLAEDMGIIADASNIESQRPITLDEAAKISVNALGYKELAQIRGGYPYGHLYIANTLSLFNGITADKDGYLSRGDAAEVIYRTLNAAPFEAESYDGKGNVKGKAFGDETLISLYRDIYCYEGIVTATPFSGLYGENGCGNERVEIDGKIYRTTVKNAEQYLGMYVKFYVSLKPSEKKTVLCFETDEYNEKLTVRGDDVISISKDYKTLAYYNGKDIEKSAKIDAGAAFLYNGVLCEDLKDEDFTAKDGYVELIDNNSDSKYDIVKIYNPRKMLVESTSEIYNTISNFVTANASLKSIVLSEGDFVIEHNGEEIGIDKIQKYDVLDVYIPKQVKNPHISISLTRSDISGKADSLDGDGVYIGGKYYEYSDFYVNAADKNDKYAPKIELGNTYRIFTDRFGKIAAAMLTEENVVYALATEIYLTEGAKPQTEIRALTSNDEWVKFEVVQKPELNGKKYKEEKDLYSDLGGETFKPQILKLKTNSGGEIIKIETAYETYETGREDFIKKPSQKENYYSPNQSFKDNVYLDSACRIFVKYHKLTGDDELDYFVTDISFLKHTYQYPFVAYNLDEYNFTDLIYIELPDTYQVVLEQEIGGMVVEKSGKKVNSDGETESFVYGGYSSSGLISLSACEEGAFDGVKKGDFILPVLDTHGKVKSYTKVYSVSDGETEEYPETTYERYGVVKGKVQKTDLDGQRVIIGSQNKPYRWVSKNIPVYIFEKSEQKVKKADVSALAADDYVVMHYMRSNLKEIMIVR